LCTSIQRMAYSYIALYSVECLFLKVLSDKRLNWSIVTRAQVS
jgi:hypothetical protein